MKPQKANRLKKILEAAEEQFLKSKEIEADAIAPALKYKNIRDREFAAFICAVLAYGKVEHIKKSVRKVLNPMGPNPVEFLLANSEKEFLILFKGWKHRFNTHHDAIHLLVLLKSIYQRETSIEQFMCSGKTNREVKDLLEDFVENIEVRLKELSVKPNKSFWFFFPKPSSGSACKRLNLYLRWMVGTGPFDFNLWKQISLHQLLIPMDVHLLNQARSLKLTRRKQADWKTVEEVTNKLKLLDAKNPTRFDFALCHLGINGKILASGLLVFFLSACQTAQKAMVDEPQASAPKSETQSVVPPIQYSKQKANFTQQDKARFLRAIKDDDVKQVRFFISMGIDVNENFRFSGSEVETPLVAALGARSKKAFNLLLEAGAQPDVWAEENNTELILAILDKQKDFALALLQKNANPDRAVKETGETALMSAARVGLCQVLLELITKGSKVDRQNEDGYTALMYAAEYGHSECLSALLAAGASIKLKNQAGRTAGDLSSEKLPEELRKKL